MNFIFRTQKEQELFITKLLLLRLLLQRTWYNRIFIVFIQNTL